tara:strand:- start:200 stop:817 length:618 start_codon:yes stop_codon:yes gene_type:complete
MELIDITKYDGVLRTDNYVSPGVYKDTYSTLVSSCTALGVPGITAPMADELSSKSAQKGKSLTSKGTASASMLLSGLLRVVANTSCGQAEITRILYGSCSSSTMVVYPNPMTNELFIGQYPQGQANSFDVSTNSMNSTQSELRSATALGAIQIEIYNFSGILVKSGSIEKSTVIPSIDVSDLRKGTYIIKITGKDIEEVHQIVKE